MNLELDRDEYLHLLHTINLADWVLHAHEIEPRAGAERFDALFRKVRAMAQEAGFGNLVAYDEEEREWFETPEYEESAPVQAVIEDYDDETFWEGLTGRLAQRDADMAEGLERMRRMDPDKAAEIIGKHEDRWWKEWEQHGLLRLAVPGQAKPQAKPPSRPAPKLGGSKGKPPHGPGRKA